MVEKIVLLDDRHLGYVKAYHEVLYAPISDPAFRTYLVILRYATLPAADGDVAMRTWVGQETLAAERRVTVRNLRYHVRELEQAGLLSIERKRNNTNVTRVLKPPVVELPWKRKAPVDIDRSERSISTGPGGSISTSNQERGPKKREKKTPPLPLPAAVLTAWACRNRAELALKAIECFQEARVLKVTLPEKPGRAEITVFHRFVGPVIGKWALGIDFYAECVKLHESLQIDREPMYGQSWPGFCANFDKVRLRLLRKLGGMPGAKKDWEFPDAESR